MHSRLFKRSHQQCSCESGKCSCGDTSPEVLKRSSVVEALDTAKKLASFLEEVDGSFRDLRSLHEAERKMAGFLTKRTELVPASVETAVSTINTMYKRFATKDFEYSPDADLDLPSDIVNESIDQIEPNEDRSKDSDVTKELGNSEVPVVKVGTSLQEFSDMDRRGFGGAQDFSDGKGPLIGTIEFSNWPDMTEFKDCEGGAVVIVGGSDTPGEASVNISMQDGFFLKNFPSKEIAISFVESLQDPVDYHQLEEEGFEPVNFDEHSQAWSKADDLDSAPSEGKESSLKLAGSELLQQPSGVSTSTPESKARWENFSTPSLAAMVKTLSGDKNFSTDSESQRAVAEMSEILASRPTVTEEEEATEVPKAAKQARNIVLGGLAIASEDPSASATKEPEADPSDPRWNLPNDSMSNQLLEGNKTQEAREKNSKQAKDNPELKDTKDVVKHLEKLLETVNGLDANPINDVLGSTRVQAVVSKVEDLITVLESTLKEVSAKVVGMEAGDEVERIKESKVKSSILRGLRLAGSE